MQNKTKAANENSDILWILSSSTTTVKVKRWSQSALDLDEEQLSYSSRKRQTHAVLAAEWKEQHVDINLI